MPIPSLRDQSEEVINFANKLSSELGPGFNINEWQKSL